MSAIPALVQVSVELLILPGLVLTTCMRIFPEKLDRDASKDKSPPAILPTNNLVFRDSALYSAKPQGHGLGREPFTLRLLFPRPDFIQKREGAPGSFVRTLTYCCRCGGARPYLCKGQQEKMAKVRLEGKT